MLIVIAHVKNPGFYRRGDTTSRDRENKKGESDGTTEEPSRGSTGALGWEEGWAGTSSEADTGTTT